MCVCVCVGLPVSVWANFDWLSLLLSARILFRAVFFFCLSLLLILFCDPLKMTNKSRIVEIQITFRIFHCIVDIMTPTFRHEHGQREREREGGRSDERGGRQTARQTNNCVYAAFVVALCDVNHISCVHWCVRVCVYACAINYNECACVRVCRQRQLID